MDNNDFLTIIVHNNYADEEIKAAFAEITSKDVVKNFDYLIKSLETATRTARDLDRRLLDKIENKDIKGRLIDLIEYQKSDDEDIRDVTASMAKNKIEEQEKIDNFEVLFQYQYQKLYDADVKRLTYELLLSIDPQKIVYKIPFLREMEKYKHSRVQRLAKRLLKNIQVSPKPENIKEIIKMIVS